MPAVHLVNLAPCDALRGDEAAAAGCAPAVAVLHQKQDGVHSGKPLPRDPTATAPTLLGPTMTTFGVVDGMGAVFDGERMVNRVLSAKDHARSIVHDWAMHSDIAVPAFVLPATDSAADKALAKAVLERFVAKKPDEAAAEAYGKAFQVAGHAKADQAWAYKQGAVAVTPRLWLPGDDGKDLDPLDLVWLLAAQETEHWEEALAAITGPTNLVVNAGIDQAGTFINSLYMGFSASTTDPTGSDTSLPGEILTAGGGLVPQSVTYAHTAGTGTFTNSATATANGSDSLPVTIAQICGRTASGGGGTMRYREKLSSTATITSSGDALTATYTLTGSAT